MSASDKIVVNSNFTKSVAKSVFSSLDRDLSVIYPCVQEAQAKPADQPPLWGGRYKILLSINRFERKKDIGLAVRCYMNVSPEERKKSRLIIAGGYDQRVAENVSYHQELVEMVESAGLKSATAKTPLTALAIPEEIQVLFLLSVPEVFKTALLQNASLLLYTPQNEHFGIVPVEAMNYGVPVLASNTGGPLETILDGRTGWLRDVNNDEEWTYIVRKLLHAFSETRKADMRDAAKKRVQENFTKQIMAQKFDDEITTMLSEKRPQFLERDQVMGGVAFVGCMIAALLVIVFRAVFKMDDKSTQFVRVDRSGQGDSGFAAPLMGQ